MLGDYTFQAHWHWLTTKDYPPSAKRVMVSNGDTVVIGGLTIQEDTLHWIFDRGDLAGYIPIAWMELPLTSPLGKS